MKSALELRHLRYFIAAAEELHFTRAADRVFLTQPALSQQIKALEEIVGAPLFDRSQRRLSLTEAGQTLLAGARRTLREAERSLQDVRRVTGTPRLALGYIEYAFQAVANPVIQGLLERHADLRIERREVTQDHIPQALRDHVIDVGIGLLPMDGPGIRSTCVLRGRWQLVMPRQHRLAQFERVELAEVGNEPLIMFSGAVNRVLFDFVLNRFRRAGVEPNVVYETQQADAGRRMALLGVGLWVTGTHVIGGDLPDGLVARELADFDATEIGFAWRTDDASPAIGTLLEILARAPA
jgi:DNA-binding transcriptional LysR family regulator